MSEFERIKGLIGKINPDAEDSENIEEMCEVCKYAGLYTEFLRANGGTRIEVYRQAIDRITSLYEPTEEYLELYFPHVSIPATFGDVNDFLAQARHLTKFTGFDEYFASWKKLGS